MTTTLAFDVGHLLAGLMLVLSFLLLYQDRILATLNVFAVQAVVLACAVAWQARVQGAPHLYVTAAVALSVKGFVIPTALHRIVRRLNIHREIEQVIGGGHGEARQAAFDRKRSAYLKSRGYRVLRFWNNEVLQEIEGVMTLIYEAVHQQEEIPTSDGYQKKAPPTPDPSPPLASLAGGGEPNRRSGGGEPNRRSAGGEPRGRRGGKEEERPA